MLVGRGLAPAAGVSAPYVWRDDLSAPSCRGISPPAHFSLPLGGKAEKSRRQIPKMRKPPSRGTIHRKAVFCGRSKSALRRDFGCAKMLGFRRCAAGMEQGEKFFLIGQLLLQPGLQLRNGHSYLRSHKRRRLWGPKADFKSSGGVNPPSGEILAAPKCSVSAAVRRAWSGTIHRKAVFCGKISRPASPPARPSAQKWALVPAPWYPGPGW